MHFLVAPVRGRSGAGFWVQATNADEARLLVSLNVPGMESAGDRLFATCEPDDAYLPLYGAIIGGAGQTYTITRRRPPKVPSPR